MKKSTCKKLALASVALCGLALVGGAVAYAPVASAEQTMKPVMANGASVRYMTEGKKDGIRFEISVTKDEYAALKTEESFKSGIVLITTSLLGENELTVQTEKIVTADTTDSWFIVYDNAEETEWHYVSRAVVTDMGVANYGVKLSARGYIYTEELGYVYSDYAEEYHSRSMQDVAKAAIAEEKDYAKLQALYAYVSTETLVDGYIYQTGETIYTLPTFDQDKPEYTVVGPNGAVEVLNGNKIVLKDAGEYTATLGENTVKVAAYTPEAYAKIVAPLTNTQFEGQVNPANKTTLEYDETMGAYKVVQPTANDQLRILKDTEAYNKIIDGAEKYNYLTVDIYFEALGGNMFFTIFKDVAGSRGIQTLGTAGTYVYDQTNGQLLNAPGQTGLSTGRWYTVYQPVTTFSSQAITNAGINPMYVNGSNSTYYIKNFKFVDALPGAATEGEAAQQGYIYKVGTELSLPMNEYGAGYTVTAPSGAVLTTGTFTLTESGVYTAVAGSETITFTAYTEAEYAKILDPMTTTQFDGQIIGINGATAAYDTEMKAYKVTQTSNNGQSVRIKNGSEAFKKVEAVRNGTVTCGYLALDIYFDVDTVPNTFFKILKDKAGTVGYQKLNTAGTYGYDGTTLRDNPGNTWFKPRQWYTIYLTVTSFTYNEGKDIEICYMNTATTGSFYLRNMQFVDALPTA